MKISGKNTGKLHRISVGILLAGLLAWAGLALLYFYPHAGQSSPQENSLFSFPSFAGDSIREVNLVVENRDWNKIVRKRKEALKSGILLTSADDEVKAKFEEGGKSFPVKIRLKGDWVDHLRGLKWSFRVSLKSGTAWNGLVTFSLMTPEARNFLHELVYHRLLEKYDILTTRYEFVWLKINGRSYGIYALEEHFEKQLVESRSRREGPIMKLSEDVLWRMRKQEVEEACLFVPHSKMPFISDIEAFNLKKTLKSPGLRKEFLVAQDLLYQAKFTLIPSHKIFDIDRMARYYAINDMCRTYHNLIWHNQRFYYNPITSLLEPIGFDGDVGHNFAHLVNDKPIIDGGGRLGRLNWKVTGDENFPNLYIDDLESMTDSVSVNNFLQEIAPELNHWQTLIQKEFPGYKWERNLFLESCKNLRDFVTIYRKANREAEL